MPDLPPPTLRNKMTRSALDDEGQLWGSHMPLVPSFMLLSHQQVTEIVSRVPHSKVLKRYFTFYLTQRGTISVHQKESGCLTLWKPVLKQNLDLGAFLVGKLYIFLNIPLIFKDQLTCNGVWECVISFIKMKGADIAELSGFPRE